MDGPGIRFDLLLLLSAAKSAEVGAAQKKVLGSNYFLLVNYC